MKLLRFLLFLMLTWLWLPVPAQAQSTVSCGFLGSKIEFADGAHTCVRDVALFKRIGLIDTAPTISYEFRIGASQSYAIATTANPNVCPFSTFISWDWRGHDASSALPGCNAKLADAVQRRGAAPGVECRCEVVVNNGKSTLSQRAFQERFAALERQVLAGGQPLDPQPAGSGARVADASGPVTATPAAPGATPAGTVAVAPTGAAQAQALAQAQAQAEAKRLEDERKAREQALARQEAERRAEQERLAQAEARLQEQDRQAREQLARQEAERRTEQERLTQVEVDRRLQEERRRLDAERERLARIEQDRAQEQVRLARELAELRRMLEERARADTANRASLSGPSQYTERVALVIGNRNYVVSPLVNPVNDARAIKDRLQAVGFKVLYYEDLRVAQIGDVLEQLHATLRPGAAFVFFYAGHGTQIDGENFFPAVDARMTSAFQMPTQSLELARVIKVAESRKAAMNLLILDACRDNPWQLASRTAARGLSKIEPAAGTLVFYATRPGSVAADGSRAGHGLFTYHLLQHLNTPMTPVEQVFKRVAAGVQRESAGKQLPWVEGQLVGEFTFAER
jgi:chemotaxis protein histidine kinase CheA